MSLIWLSPMTATLILLSGLVEDLRSRKVRNQLILVCAACAIIVSFVVGRWSGVFSGLGGMITALVLTLPLVWIKALGAGDMKLMMAFGLVVNWTVTYEVLAFAIIWGAVFGLIKILLQGELMNLITNIGTLVQVRKNQNLAMHQVPFTVAIFLGWLTYLKYAGVF